MKLMCPRCLEPAIQYTDSLLHTGHFMTPIELRGASFVCGKCGLTIPLVPDASDDVFERIQKSSVKMDDDKVKVGDLVCIVENTVASEQMNAATRILRNKMSELSRARSIVKKLEAEFEELKKMNVEDIGTSDYRY